MGFNVCGGSIDQNLVLLDEVLVYNFVYLFGFFLVFNLDVVKDVEFFKGGILFCYGGCLLFILDVCMKEGNSKCFIVNGGVGVIFSCLVVEVFIVKDKVSFIVVGCCFYIDVLVVFFFNDDLGEIILNFYDLMLKINYKFNENNQLFLSGYFGCDNFGFGDVVGFSWGNMIIFLCWNYIFSNKFFVNIMFYFSDYDYSINFGDIVEDVFDWMVQIMNYSVKFCFIYYVILNNIV